MGSRQTPQFTVFEHRSSKKKPSVAYHAASDGRALRRHLALLIFLGNTATNALDNGHVSVRLLEDLRNLGEVIIIRDKVGRTSGPVILIRLSGLPPVMPRLDLSRAGGKPEI
jgi:hypothetical protein